MRHMPNSSEAEDGRWAGSDHKSPPHESEQSDHHHHQNSTSHPNTTDPCTYARGWPSSDCHKTATSDDVGMGHERAANSTASALHHPPPPPPPPPPLPSSVDQPSSSYPSTDGSDRQFSCVPIPLGAFVVIMLFFLALKGIFVFLMWRRRERRRVNAVARPAGRPPEQVENGRTLGGVDEKGLDPTLVSCLPIHVFRAESSKGGRAGGGGGGGRGGGGDCESPVDGEGEPGRLRECPVCLCDYEDGDKVKMIPMCSHGFHTECIDAWLGSKTTCPLCRVDLRPPKSPLPPCEGESEESTSTGDGARGAGLQEAAGAEASAGAAPRLGAGG